MTRRFLRSLSLLVLFLSSVAASALDSNFPNRKAIVLNTCPYVELSQFSFQNRFVERGTRFEQNMSWKNVGAQPLVAFEIVVLKYDAFNRRLLGTRWTVTGKDSADWTPLPPGTASKDGTRGYGEEEVFTAIAYVRAARLADGTV